MNIYLFGFIAALFFISCKQQEKKTASQEPEPELNYNSFGDEFSSDIIISSGEMEEQYKNLNPGDTLQFTFKGTVNSVCRNKGCWMQVDLPEGEEDVMVKFKDYRFFVPLNIDNKEVVVKGKAYVSEVSVEEQRHYAKDKGQNPEEVAAIVEPKRTLSFLADGVLVEKPK